MFSSLRREQKEAIGLLQVGTFLEYFDLMLYIHMAVLLNDLFFPKTDPHTAALLTAFAFCSTYVLRPFGAFLFGYIGDHIGRKTTVVMTTTMMAVSCIIMANLPTYSQIGITASWIVTVCRIVQGLSSMGEVVGAGIYLTETIKVPERYFAVSLITLSTALGSAFALGISSLVTLNGLNWRIAFWIGACIALVGAVARTRLRETPEFADMKRRMKRVIKDSYDNGLGEHAELLKSTNPIWKEKIDKKTILASFLVQSGWPVFFYFTYMYCGNMLKTKFGCTSEQIISHNFKVSLFQIAHVLVAQILCRWVYPLSVLKLYYRVGSCFILIIPFVLDKVSSPFELLCLQAFFILFALNSNPANAILVTYLPILRRFTCDTITYASSRAIVYMITSFGLVYLTESFGQFGLWFILIPVCIGYIWGVQYFDKLEREQNDYHPTNRASAEFALKRLQEEMAASRYSRLQERANYPTQEKTLLP
ncbi:MAG: MFS transporter [Caedimonas sp.]|nr:MFS transporter [Caedimonas sp.]